MTTHERSRPAPASRTTSAASDHDLHTGGPRVRRGLNPAGWWGIAFVLGNLVCQGAVSLPKTTHTPGFIAAYYGEHRTVITLAQVGELLITVLVWRWVRALGDSQPDVRTRRLLRWCSWAVVGCSFLTTFPVLALAWLADPSTRLVEVLATWTDLSDVVLFVVVTALALLCARTGFPRWLRIIAVVLTVLAVGRVALYLVGSAALDNGAALAFMVFILATSAWMLRQPRPGGAAAELTADGVPRRAGAGPRRWWP
jgi:hypothetical protein